MPLLYVAVMLAFVLVAAGLRRWAFTSRPHWAVAGGLGLLGAVGAVPLLWWLAFQVDAWSGDVAGTSIWMGVVAGVLVYLTIRRS